MSSELVKKLEDKEHTLRENLFYKSDEEYDHGYIRGFWEAMSIVEQHEVEQMKGMDLRELVNDEANFATPEEAEKLFIQAGYELEMKEPFYQLDGEKKSCFSALMRLADNFEFEEEHEEGIRLKAVLHKFVSDAFKNEVPIDLAILNAITQLAIEQDKVGGDD
ncbi:hypothetical protein ACORB6_002939 [Listeria monocytogenes]|nr:hypothetical protein [Listeria monocytogenes]EAE1498757.1 hypothetical protein [Listeria monocytogenes]HDI3721972.1 hypothetical protein [Listeria monocytogenes]HDU3385671.1 hypothetical protein [Listeria monocytogenes]